MRYTRQSRAIHFHLVHAMYQPATNGCREEGRRRASKCHSFVFLRLPVLRPLVPKKDKNKNNFSAEKAHWGIGSNKCSLLSSSTRILWQTKCIDPHQHHQNQHHPAARSPVSRSHRFSPSTFQRLISLI